MTLPEILSQYGWLIAAAVLLGLETVLPGVFLLFFGIAAAIVGVNVLVLGADDFFGWGQQVFAFLALTGIGVFLGRHRYGAKDEKGGGNLNRRTDALVGRQGLLVESITHGRGRMAVDDGWWTVEGPELASGERVRIVGAKGNVLVVEHAADPSVRMPAPSDPVRP